MTILKPDIYSLKYISGFSYNSYVFYSLLSAITGSFLAASLDGISPPINVSMTLIMTNITPPFQGSDDTPATLMKLSITLLIGMLISIVTPIPMSPEKRPIINVSALNTLEISFFEAPMLRRIPISFVLSSTEIYVMIPIMMDETINDIATNAMST